MEAGRFWSGLALGGDEAAALLWNPQTRLFTLLGTEDRGKTCLLTAIYIQLANDFTRGFPWRFCGSRSLQGFQRLTDPAIAWRGGEDRIVPRTTHASYRQPSFLHLALKRRDGAQTSAQHVLLTDMPGQWFKRWIDFGSEAMKDTLEFLPRSDGFFLVIDAVRLQQDHAYKLESQYLLNRLLELLHTSNRVQRPVALVLTKYDKVIREIEPPAPGQRCVPKNWGALAERIKPLLLSMANLPADTTWDVFPTAAFSRPAAQPVGVLAPLAFLLMHTTATCPLPPIYSPPSLDGTFFEMFRETEGA